MLDLGEGAFAMGHRAHGAGGMEAGGGRSYDTFEMINIATGRGGWFHQFGGLSCPVVSVGVRVFPARHGELRF